MFIRTGKKIGRRSIKPRRQRFLRLEPLEDRRVLAYTSIATATTAVMTGDLASDTIAFDSSGGNLSHNRFTAGDPGFESDQDFDSTQVGVQTLLADGSATVTVNAGDGDDTIDFANGIVLNGPVDGEGGMDTLDYGDYATQVAVNLGLSVSGLSGAMGEGQENPPTGSAATGTATVSNFDPVAKTFDITVTVTDLNPAVVNGFHIHRGVVGVNGSIIIDLFGLSPLTPVGTGFTFTTSGVSLATSALGGVANEASFLGGVTYVNIHTTAFGGGEIRGQLFSTGNVNLNAVGGPGGSATGTTGITNIENVTGGTGADSLVGSFVANSLIGGGGGDTIVGGPNPSPTLDMLQGDAGADTMVWSNGDGTDVMDGGSEADIVQVNASVAANDVFEISDGAGGRIDFDRTSPGPFSLDIGTTERLIVNGVGGDDTFTANSLTVVANLNQVDLNGFDGSDTFNVTPSSLVTYFVDGDPPLPPAAPGDSLSVPTAGTTNPSLTMSSITSGFTGSYTFGNRLPVNFRAIETLDAGADISVTKNDTPDPAVAGNNLTYTITVSNSGPSDALSVQLSDTIPTGTTFVSFTAPAGFTTMPPPVGGTGTVTSSIATLPASAVATFTLVVQVNSTTLQGTTLSNTASASTTTTDPTPGNNSDTETTAVNAQADLRVTKTDSPDPVAAGANLTYTITVTNLGPSDSQSVLLSDAVPTNTTFVSAIQASGPAFTPSLPPLGGTGTFTASAATLEAGATATFTLVVNVNTGVSNGTVLSNTANVSSTTTDPVATNNSDTETTAVGTPSADLVVTKTDTPDPAVAGNNLTYTITVSNSGPSDALSVQLSDTIPTGTTFVSFTAPAGFTTMPPPVGGTGTVTSSIATLPASAVATFTLVVQVDSTTLQGTTLSNTASASTTTTDPTPGNNSDTETTAVIAQADLSVNKNDSPDPVVAGTNLTYTITLTNSGPSDAQAVTLSDATPANTTFVSAMQQSGPAFAPTSPPVGGTGTFSATAANFAAGATATFTIVVNVNASAPSGPLISNTATVSSSTTDPDSGDNSDTETTAVITQADLSVTKTDSPDPVAAGANLTYTITVTNAGPSGAQNVTLTDVIPTNTTLVAFTAPAGWTVVAPAPGGTGTITADRPSFAAGATATFTLIVNVNTSTPQAATISNTVSLSSTTADPNLANNADTETTTVTGVSAQVDVSVTKDDSPDPVEAGTNITYTITVTNTGSSSATGVSLTDAIPANTTFVSFTAPAGWTTTTPTVGGAGVITATNPTVVAGDTEVFTLIVNVNASTPPGPNISNTATVIVSSGDSNLANNTSTQTTDVGTVEVPGLPECEVITLNSPGDPGTATLEDDADNPGTGVLIVTGTSGNDVIVIEPRPRNAAQLRVTRNGRLVGLFTRSEVQHIVAFGLVGNDKIVVNATLLQPATLFGDAGNDYLYGAKGADGLEGGSGVDRLFGGSNNDTLCGGDGNDFVYGQAGNDFAGGDAGNDKVFGEAGNDFLVGNDGNDSVYGGAGNDRMFGQAGNDQVFGEAGNDIGLGGDGNDKLYGGSGRDVLIGGDGLDTLFGNGQDDILVAGSTAHDEDDEALQAILAEWTSTNSYTTRVNNIRNGGGANGAFVLDDTTVSDDGVKDTLFGDGGLDWFLFGGSDKIKDKASSELVN